MEEPIAPESEAPVVETGLESKPVSCMKAGFFCKCFYISIQECQEKLYCVWEFVTSKTGKTVHRFVGLFFLRLVMVAMKFQT